MAEVEEIEEIKTSTDATLTAQMQVELEMMRRQVAMLGSPELAPPQGTEMEKDAVVGNLIMNEEMREDQTCSYKNGDVYKGDMLGTLRHGYGVHSCSNGDVYRGHWRLDKRHGTGKMIFNSGLQYDGAWEDDLACGYGICTYPNGNIYCGDWKKDHRWGWGRLDVPNGEWFEGEWYDDQIEGNARHTLPDGSYFEGLFSKTSRTKGRFVSADGSMDYEGDWKGILRHGKGTMQSPGLRYQGDWVDDLMQGKGISLYTDGSKYEGEFHQGQRQGQGKLCLPDGTTHVGVFGSGCPDGPGQCIYGSGEKHSGTWKEGKRHGKGKCILPNGDKYDGEWEDDKRHGDGKCVYNNGDMYQGSWKNGMRHGFGVCKFHDSKIFKGEWEEDGWVQSTAEPTLCKMFGGGISRAVAGEIACFEIKAFDESGNERLCGGDDFRCRLDGPSTVHGKLVDHDDGSYTFEYTALTSGRYQLHCTIGGVEEVEQSPYPVLVLPGAPKLKNCRVTGPGRSHAVLAAPSSFLIEAVDNYGNLVTDSSIGELLPVEVVMSLGEAECPVLVSPKPKLGALECSYTAKADGFYRLQVTSQGKHLPGSPFSLVVASESHKTFEEPSTAQTKQAAVSEETKAHDDPAEEVQGGETSGLGGTTAPVHDLSTHWMTIAASAFGEDGCMDGWDSDTEEPSDPDGDYAKLNPNVPVVENLEDIWKVTKLQRERKAREHREKQQRLQTLRNELERRYGPQLVGSVVSSATGGGGEGHLQGEATRQAPIACLD